MTKPVVCFLPGFMGQATDFDALLPLLADSIESTVVDWPEMTPTDSFEQNSRHLWQQLSSDWPETFYIYGYSMGGRVALSWLSQPEIAERCEGVFVAGAHPGLMTNAERDARWQHDAQWATRFETEPLADVLQSWYQQPVFSSLTDDEKKRQIQRKLNQSGTVLAQQLRALSLAKQPDYREDFKATQKAAYIVGSEDRKFSAVSDEFCPPSKRIHINQAGHLVHAEQPAQLALVMSDYIENWRV